MLYNITEHSLLETSFTTELNYDAKIPTNNYMLSFGVAKPFFLVKYVMLASVTYYFFLAYTASLCFLASLIKCARCVAVKFGIVLDKRCIAINAFCASVSLPWFI
jgi:hypothetical protein